LFIFAQHAINGPTVPKSTNRNSRRFCIDFAMNLATGMAISLAHWSASVQER
jgi:hypothetical protein